jgi:hypothetical protein
MAIKFFADRPSFNAGRNTMRLPAFDGNEVVLVSVTREALEDAQEASTLLEESLITAFQIHRPRILEAARKLVGSGTHDRPGIVMVGRAALAAEPWPDPPEKEEISLDAFNDVLQARCAHLGVRAALARSRGVPVLSVARPFEAVSHELYEQCTAICQAAERYEFIIQIPNQVRPTDT